jgi:hypothetical protein
MTGSTVTSTTGAIRQPTVCTARPRYHPSVDSLAWHLTLKPIFCFLWVPRKLFCSTVLHCTALHCTVLASVPSNSESGTLVFFHPRLMRVCACFDQSFLPPPSQDSKITDLQYIHQTTTIAAGTSAHKASTAILSSHRHNLHGAETAW